MALPISITEDDRILIIAPHPDDESIGVGGLLVMYSKQCDVIVMTDGRYGGVGTSPEKEWKIRKRQFENGMSYANVNMYKWLGYSDGALLNQKDCMKDIDFSQYTKIFLPCGEDNHTDHAAAFIYAVEQIKAQNVMNAEVFQYEVHVPFHDVSDYLDITSYINEKMKLIQFHEEQVRAYAYDMLAKALAGYRACQGNQPEKYYETYVKTDIVNMSLTNKYVERERILQKYKQFYRILIKWIGLKDRGKNIASFLKEKEIQKVIIYGYADIGKILYKELEKSDIYICGVLDKHSIDSGEMGITVCNPSDGDRTADAVLVTAVLGFDEIRTELKSMGYSNIYWVSAIIEGLENT